MSIASYFSFKNLAHVCAVGYGDFKAAVGFGEAAIAKVASSPLTSAAVEGLTSMIPVAGPELVRIEQALMGQALAYMHAKATTAPGQPLPPILTPELEAALQPVLGSVITKMAPAIATLQTVVADVQTIAGNVAAATKPVGGP